MFEVSFSQASRLNSFFLLVSTSLGWSSGFCKLWVGYDFCLFFLCWGRLSEVVILSADDWVYIFVCCLDEASCIGCHWYLGDAGLGLVF